jgi:hypothetical protein
MTASTKNLSQSTPDDESARVQATAALIAGVIADEHPDVYGESIKRMRTAGVLVAGMDGGALYHNGLDVVTARKLAVRDGEQEAPAPQADTFNALESLIIRTLEASDEPMTDTRIMHAVRDEWKPSGKGPAMQAVAVKKAFKHLVESGRIRQVADGYTVVTEGSTAMAATVEATANQHGLGHLPNMDADTKERFQNLGQAVAALDPADGEVPEWMAKEIVSLNADERRAVRAYVVQAAPAQTAENGARFQVTGLLTSADVRAAQEQRTSKGGKAPAKAAATATPKPVKTTSVKAQQEPKPAKIKGVTVPPSPFAGVAQPTQDAVRVINLFAKKHGLDDEAKTAILQNAIKRALGQRRATHVHALESVDELAAKNKIEPLDREQLLNPAEKAALAALRGGTAWDKLDTRGKAGARYFGIVDADGNIVKR